MHVGIGNYAIDGETQQETIDRLARERDGVVRDNRELVELLHLARERMGQADHWKNVATALEYEIDDLRQKLDTTEEARVDLEKYCEEWGAKMERKLENAHNQTRLIRLIVTTDDDRVYDEVRKCLDYL